MLPYFQVLPFADVLFTDLTFSGIALLVVNGLTNLTAAALLFRKEEVGRDTRRRVRHYAYAVDMHSLLYVPAELHVEYLLRFRRGAGGDRYAAWVFCCQEHFCVSEKEYPNIGKAPDRLVVYFSRMGYTKKAALEEAVSARVRAYLRSARQNVPKERSAFWWCGRYGYDAWDMPIAGIPSDLEAYSRVTVCSPIWVFGLSAPMRILPSAARGKIKEADLHIGSPSEEQLLRGRGGNGQTARLENSPTVSICCRRGNYTKSVSRVPRT